jgi:hypothetical protein
VLADDADRWRDEEYYRRRVREMVLEVPDQELRKQIMNKISDHRYEQYQLREMRSLFEREFAGKLWAERSLVPRPSRDMIWNCIWPPAFFCIAYWVAYVFSGVLDALVAGVGAFLPVLVLYAVRYVVHYFQALHRHDVNLQEAVQYVERAAAISEREARLIGRPEVFSRREKRTGEADEEIA